MTGPIPEPEPDPCPALAASNLAAGYLRRRRGRTVVTSQRLAARLGELTAVVGPNGSGKTTLLRTLIGALPPLWGTVEVDGRPLHRLSRRERARLLAVVLTDRVDPGQLTVGEVVTLGRHPYVGWTGHVGAHDVAAAQRAAETVGIGELWAMPFDELSDGQRQRSLIARALAQDPAVIVLDEPTAYLDLPGRATITATLAHLADQAGVAVVVSTHDLDLALAHADQVWLVADGTVTVGAPDELLYDGSLAAAFAVDGFRLDPATVTMRPIAGP
jgi:iron complex transport system ATP-binding protein